MKNKNTKLDIFNNDSGYFKERFFVFQKEVIEVLGDVSEPLGDVLSAASDLLGLTTDVLGKAVDLVETGVAYTEHGVKLAIEAWEDPGEPKKLPELKYFLNYFDLIDAGGGALQNAVNYHLFASFMEIKLFEVDMFYQYSLAEFQAVEEKYNAIRQNRWHYEDKIEELREEIIPNTERAIESGNYLPDDPKLDELRANLKAYKKELDYYEQLCSYEVTWTTYEEIEVEYPPFSGQYKRRFVPSKDGSKSTVDIRDLYDFLQVNTADLNSELEKFGRELEIYVYRREKILENDLSGFGDRVEFSIYREQIDDKKKELKNQITFKEKGDRIPLTHLFKPVSKSVESNEMQFLDFSGINLPD